MFSSDFEFVRCVLARFSVHISVLVRLPVILQECSNVRNVSAEQGFSLWRCPQSHHRHFVSGAPPTRTIPIVQLVVGVEGTRKFVVLLKVH